MADTLPTVFDGYFSTTSFEGCLIRVADRGGDADTAGAIAGARAGATCGVNATPKRWLKALNREVATTIHALAPRLLVI